jgi:HK97 family phage major capsid protein
MSEEIRNLVTDIATGVDSVKSEVASLGERMGAAEEAIRKPVELGTSAEETRQWSWGDYMRGVRSGDFGKGFTAEAVAHTRANLGTTTSAAPIPVEVANTIIEPLKAKSIIGKAGATFLDGLAGSLRLNKFATAELQDRATDVAGVSDQSGNWVPSQVTLTPSYSGELVIVSRDLLAQSVPSVDAFIEAELMRAALRKLDVLGLAAIQGLTSTTDAAVTAAGDKLERAHLEAALVGLQAANANTDGLAFVAHPSVKKHLLQDAGTAGRTWLRFASDKGLAEETGFQVLNTTNFNDDTGLTGEAVLGDFSKLVVGMFGSGIEIAASEDYKFGDNAVTFRVVLAADAAVIQDGAFQHWDNLGDA